MLACAREYLPLLVDNQQLVSNPCIKACLHCLGHIAVAVWLIAHFTGSKYIQVHVLYLQYCSPHRHRLERPRNHM